MTSFWDKITFPRTDVLIFTGVAQINLYAVINNLTAMKRSYLFACLLPISYGISYYGHLAYIKHCVNERLLVADYVKNHPEDFPELKIKKKKIGEIYEPWIPVRGGW
ncbi:hypothetical protein A3Q56_01160 [Intoshia linei]|uniref:NADH dehydrogenase [ubiquinone] 1 subunit C2 n=1 Tax=Intoshia linei TaxID=1819745 RepID=A0A177B9U1_9BILA|nr:hypothetical protein A3Q56_01160 [Intoshia linei]